MASPTSSLLAGAPRPDRMGAFQRAQEEEMNAAREQALIVVGPGERLEELSAALGGLLGRVSGSPVRLVGIEDLAQLLLLRSGSGELLLDGDLVPPEDIGILRRFLEGRSGWSLSVVGEDQGALERRGLLGLGQSRFLRWPPDLSVLRAIARGGAREASPAAAPAMVPLPDTAVRSRPPRSARNGTFDLCALLDDLIVGRAVSEAAADYDFQASEELRVGFARDEAASMLEGFLGLAEACAGPDQRVEVRARQSGGEALLELVFPPGALTDGDLPALLGGGPFQGPRELRAAAEGARGALERCAELDGRATLGTARPGRLLLAVHLPLA